jgi:hypothetical protein
MPSYVANGKQFFERGFHLTWSNPYAGYDSPAIYFQPHLFLLGLMQQLGLDPGITYNFFNLLTLFFAAFVAIRFYQEVVGDETRAKRLGLVCFFWGGGILTLAGLVYGLIRDHRIAELTRFDPSTGWWMLNFGRNLVFPTEAYYHGLFLLSLLALLRGRMIQCLAWAALLSCSHPFTGLTLICILIAYSAVELVLRSGIVTVKFLAVAIVLAVLHLAYYLIWLNRFSDHRVLETQWRVDWLYKPETFIPALLIVAFFAAWRIGSSAFQCFRDARVRLFAVWFVVVFALTQHNLVVRHPFQPIHFARGYDWMALFFIGAPALIAVFEHVLRISAPMMRGGILAGLLCLFLLDNAFWLIDTSVRNPYQISLTRDQTDVLRWLSSNVKAGDMVVCRDTMVSYLVPTYTSARSWQGHMQNTPFIEQKHDDVESFFGEGRIVPAWAMEEVVYVSPAAWTPPAGLQLQRHYENGEFSIWERSN